jgi:hypothetical protein
MTVKHLSIAQDSSAPKLYYQAIMGKRIHSKFNNSEKAVIQPRCIIMFYHCINIITLETLFETDVYTAVFKLTSVSAFVVLLMKFYLIFCVCRTRHRRTTYYDGSKGNPFQGVCHIPIADPFCPEIRKVFTGVMYT